MSGCQRLATWHLVDGPGIEDYTHACDLHVGALRSVTTTEALVIPEEYPCCFIGDAALADQERQYEASLSRYLAAQG